MLYTPIFIWTWFFLRSAHSLCADDEFNFFVACGDQPYPKFSHQEHILNSLTIYQAIERTCLLLHIINLNDQNNEMYIEGYDIFLTGFRLERHQKRRYLFRVIVFRAPCAVMITIRSSFSRKKKVWRENASFLSVDSQLPTLMLNYFNLLLVSWFSGCSECLVRESCYLYYTHTRHNIAERYKKKFHL